MAQREEMNIADTIKKYPWVPFLGLALAMQQANMMAYKLAGETALPQTFLAYSFLFQTFLNVLLAFFFKSRGFPLVLKGKMRLWVLFVFVVYLANEVIFINTFVQGAPYSLLMVVFSCTSLMLLMLYAVVALKEKINIRQMTGLVLAFAAIYLIRMG